MITSISDNVYYTTICKLAANDEYCFKTFKQNPNYKIILEHTSYDLGLLYLTEIVKLIKNENDVIDLIKKTKINDLHGGSEIKEFKLTETTVEISPSSLRYLYIGLDLINKFGSLKNKTICEIGGGYGGQCTVINGIDGFSSWHIIDLPEANMLQERYLRKNQINNTKVFNLSNIDNVLNKYDIVISNYAFSECKKSIQDVYMDKIISKAKNGYMLMNFCWDDESHGIGWQKINGYENMMNENNFRNQISNLKIIKEIPETHPKNKLYYW